MITTGRLKVFSLDYFTFVLEYGRMIVYMFEKLASQARWCFIKLWRVGIHSLYLYFNFQSTRDGKGEGERY